MPHQRTERWKWARRIALCLVLGAVINVGVAWGCAAWSPRTVSTYTLLDQIFGVRAGPPPWARGAEMVMGGDLPDRGGFGFEEWNSWWGARWLSSDDPKQVWPTHDYSRTASGSVRTTGVGWPMLALRSESWSDSATSLVDVGLIRGGIPIGPVGQYAIDRRKLPIMPIWFGFLVNTLLYGALMMTPFAPGAIMRCRRVCRGRCRGCGYDVAGLAVCPECGSSQRHQAIGSRGMRLTRRVRRHALTRMISR